MKISKKTLALFAGLALLTALLWKLDFAQIADKLRNMNGWLFAASIFWIVMGQVAGYSKWVVMKHKTYPGKKIPLAAIYSSVFVTGMITPARTGDLLASFAWPAYQGSILAWSILNRILEGGMTLLIALGVLGFFFGSAMEGFRWGGLVVFSFFAAAGTFFIFSRKWGAWFFEKIKKFLRSKERWGWARKLSGFEAAIEKQMGIFYDTLDEMRKAHALASVILLTVAARLCTIASNYYLLHSLGAEISLQGLMGILALTWVSCFFSPTPNGLGIGDVPPSLLLSHLGYQAHAGSFVLLNRLMEVGVTVGWAVTGLVSQKLFKKKHVKELL